LFPEGHHQVDPRFAETDYGELEGRDLEELHVEQPDLWDRWLRDPDAFRFPGGETYAEVQARALEGLEAARLTHPDGLVAIVTHGGVIRALTAAVLGAGAHATGRLRIAPLHHVELRYWSGIPVVERTNAR
jgi:broad specificity phosphatase PhoE